MRSSARFAFPVLAFAALGLFARSAAAQENPAPSTAPATAERPVNVLVGFNPLPLTYGAISGSAEVIVAGHFGFAASVHGVTEKEDVAANEGEGTGSVSQHLSGFGGEIGFHYYPVDPRSHVVSLWFGPSVLAGSYTYEASTAPGSFGGVTSGMPGTSTNTSFTRTGAAMDVGMLIFARPFMAQIGFGAQMTSGAPDMNVPQYGFFPSMTTSVWSNGIHPRVVASIGVGF